MDPMTYLMPDNPDAAPNLIETTLEQLLVAPLESASKKEVADLTDGEQMAIILASGARVEIGEAEHDGQPYLRQQYI